MSKKKRVPIDKKKLENRAPAAAISDISIYSWGTCKYGQYLLFSFNSRPNIGPITQMNYKILSGNTVLDNGAVPYLFNNAQIIYTKKEILNKKLKLSISIVDKNNTETPNVVSPPAILNPSPYINTNYFERDKTTTKATTRATTEENTTLATTTLLPKIIVNLDSNGSNTYQLNNYPSGTKISGLLIGGGARGETAITVDLEVVLVFRIY